MKKQVWWYENKKKGVRVSPFSICDDTLIYANRIVIPCILQKRILKDFHLGHPGMSRVKTLICSYVYWPKMDPGIENVIKYCKGCQLAAKGPPVKTQPWLKTDVPWTRIDIDYASPLKGYYYLVIVDICSKWLEIYKHKHPTASSTIKALHKVFS